MTGTWPMVTAGVVLTTAWAMAARPAEAQTGTLSLTVVTHDTAALPPGVLERAKAFATKVYRQIDVQLDWWDTNRLGAEMSTGLGRPPALPASAIHVRLLPDSGNRSRPAAGEHRSHPYFVSEG